MVRSLHHLDCFLKLSKSSELRLPFHLTCCVALCQLGFLGCSLSVLSSFVNIGAGQDCWARPMLQLLPTQTCFDCFQIVAWILQRGCMTFTDVNCQLNRIFPLSNLQKPLTWGFFDLFFSISRPGNINWQPHFGHDPFLLHQIASVPASQFWDLEASWLSASSFGRRPKHLAPYRTSRISCLQGHCF